MLKTFASSLKHNSRFKPISSQDEKLISLLQSCTRSTQISQVHGLMVKTGLDHSPFPLSKLLASSIQDINYASSIFTRVRNPNLFMYTTMLRGFSQGDNPEKALLLFNHVRTRRIALDQFSFVPTIKACARVSATLFGLGIHGLIVRSGHGVFIDVKNTLLHLYCVWERIGDAQELFDESPERVDIVSWNALLNGYIHVSQPAIVIDLFRKMGENALKIGVATVLSALLACTKLKIRVGGESLHGHCVKSNLSADTNVVTALIKMYAKTGDISSGIKIFNEAPERDVVLWNCLIGGYAKCGHLEESLSMLELMKSENVEPDSSTLAGLLSACFSSGALGLGQKIHKFVKEQRVALDAVLGTALVDMYSKCGFIDKAIDAFEMMENKDVKAWTAMISGYGAHGKAEKSIDLFLRMESEGFQPNEVTFLAVLSACSHGGLVREAMISYQKMIREYGASPKIEHFGCMIDLLGRAGLLEEAHNLLKRLPFQGDTAMWRALLSACRVHGNVELGEVVKREIAEKYDDHPADSLLLSGACAIAGRLLDHAGVWEMRKEETALKEPGCSIIDIGGLGT